MDKNGYKVLEDKEDSFRLNDEAGCRLKDGAIHMKVVTSYGDPVELTSTEAQLIAEALLRLAKLNDHI